MLKYCETGDKASCYGCSACVAACKFNAVALLPDSEGFLYPRIDSDRCVGCSACEKACPFGREDLFLPNAQLAFAVQAKDSDVLAKSASGAAFALLAISSLGSGSYSCGCVFDGGWKAKHVVSNDSSMVGRMLGSKYVQSDMGHCYEEIRALLVDGQHVIFSGTPCQVAGLVSYLEKPYENLLTIDLICHGVPSQKLLDYYLAKEASSFEIEDFRFRDKSRNGWCSNGTIVKRRNGKSIVRRTSPYDDTYYHLYLANAVSRESCYTCAFARPERVSDVTIGDYWNADSANLGFDYSKGTSIVIANSEKGHNAICDIQGQSYCEKVDILHAIAGNGNLSRPCERPAERNTAYKTIDEIGYKAASKQLCSLKPWLPIIRRLIPSGIKKSLKRVLNA